MAGFLIHDIFKKKNINLYCQKIIVIHFEKAYPIKKLINATKRQVVHLKF